MLGKLVDTIKRLSGPTEESTDYNGVFSYAKEYHSFLIGFGGGIAAVITNQPLIAGGIITVALGLKATSRFDTKAVKEITKEPWYAIGGVLLGYSPMLVTFL